MRSSVVAAGLLVLVLALWMASGLFTGDQNSDAEANSATTTEGTENASGDGLMKVQVAVANLESRAREIVLQGQIEPARVLAVRAETSSTIETLPVAKGQRVRANDVIATLALNGRDVDLAEADAQVVAAVSQQNAAAELRKQGLQSKVQSQQANASLASAQAQRNRIQRDIANTQITAPFNGIVNALPVELGELVNSGDTIAQLVDDSSFKVSAQVAQQSVSELNVGQAVDVELITGQVLRGELTFVASVADSQTRSFTVEAKVRSTGEPIAAGVSASLRIPVETVETVFLTPSALALGDAGELGVKLVDEQDTVQFIPVSLLSTTIDGAWVTGIPTGSRVITLGQAFVAVGEKVDPIPQPESNSGPNAEPDNTQATNEG